MHRASDAIFESVARTEILQRKIHVESCEHFQKVAQPYPHPRTKGCEECLATGGHWVELRVCLTCGHVGCCDSSPGKHATAHFQETNHEVMQSFEPGDTWGWCYVHELMLGPLSPAKR